MGKNKKKHRRVHASTLLFFFFDSPPAHSNTALPRQFPSLLGACRLLSSSSGICSSKFSSSAGSAQVSYRIFLYRCPRHGDLTFYRPSRYLISNTFDLDRPASLLESTASAPSRARQGPKATSITQARVDKACSARLLPSRCIQAPRLVYAYSQIRAHRSIRRNCKPTSLKNI